MANYNTDSLYCTFPATDLVNNALQELATVNTLWHKLHESYGAALRYSRQLRIELDELYTVLGHIDNDFNEPLTRDGLDQELALPSLPDINGTEPPSSVQPPYVTVWPEITTPDAPSYELSPVADTRSLLPVHRRLPEFRAVELNPVPSTGDVLPGIEPLPVNPPELAPLQVPPAPNIEPLERSPSLDRELTPPTVTPDWSPGQPIDELPHPLNTSEWWEARAEQLGLPTNREVVRALDFQQMQTVQDEIAGEVIDAMHNGRGSVSGAMIRSIMTNQRLNIFGVDEAPDNDIDSVTATVINNFYVDYSNEGRNAPNTPRVSDKYWTWFLDIGRSDFDEYLELSLDDLPIEEF